jgi:hypothetical protein
MSNEHNLNDKWVIWYHKLHDDNWKIDSYKKVFEFNTVEQFWNAYHQLLPMMNRGIILIMKEGILPIWECPENIDGCSISYLSDNLRRDWKELWMGLVSNCLLEKKGVLNGISSTPKFRKYLFKIWLKDCDEHTFNKDFQINLSSSKKKIHKENI